MELLRAPLVVIFVVGCFLVRWVSGFEAWNVSEFSSMDGDVPAKDSLMVRLTLIPSAAAKGAVCLDGTVPGYHIHRGSGSGANNWLIQIEGGGWCNTIRSCVYRKTTRRGSSNYMEKILPFTGILSDKPDENPDFYSWNRVKLRYCDGASFTGDGQDEAAKLYFRGQRIWQAGMEELMSLGMRNAGQVLLSGCSAGGVASIVHCDEFRELFPVTENSCAFYFIRAYGSLSGFRIDVAGGRTLRNLFGGVVNLQGAGQSLPTTCTSHMDPTSGIAKSVGDWYYERSEVKAIDCPYPCDKTCHDLVFEH
ncbi:hypothetical protein QJS04_geneDACA015766 [Acorus gramineus]|uniref:Pectin acetylesterase n=1 Tax=Acorus gramineus TaxID=55184 RepID=A0AAV9BKA5_ACOGR|nr:hypothetical protein QJS04_geneDACA015766 [Acorus gramineus]